MVIVIQSATVSVFYAGSTCPACPFWAGRDRWMGKRLD
jgi:hypothetical protein